MTHSTDTRRRSGPDGVPRHCRLVRVVDRGRWLVRADEDGSEAHALVAPEGIGLFTAEDADRFLAAADPRNRTTAAAPRGGYLLNPLWLLVLAAGAWAAWRLYRAASTGGGRRWWRRSAGLGHRHHAQLPPSWPWRTGSFVLTTREAQGREEAPVRAGARGADAPWHRRPDPGPLLERLLAGRGRFEDERTLILLSSRPNQRPPCS